MEVSSSKPTPKLFSPTLAHVSSAIIILKQLASREISEQDVSLSDACVSSHKKDLILKQKALSGHQPRPVKQALSVDVTLRVAVATKDYTAAIAARSHSPRCHTKTC